MTAVDSATPLVASTLSKNFRQGASLIHALAGVSLTVQRGEFTAVMGASGSGKSTLLHVMAGLTRPDAGRVFINGQDLALLSDAELTRFRRTHIGLVFQAFNLIPTLTAEENILLPLLAGHRQREAAGRLEPLLESLGIAGRRRHRPDSLSGGEQQRVAIARALITEPTILLADEPTGSLDSVTGQGLCRLLRDLCNRQHSTIVVVTHEPAVAAWADRIVILRDGQLVEQLPSPGPAHAQSLAAQYLAVVSNQKPAEVPA